METPNSLKDNKILIVDDVASMRNMTNSILRGAGFNNLHEASDGAIALKLLRKRPIDLVICDWIMPNLSGLALFKAANADEDLKNILFLMLTGSSDIDKVKEAITAGVTDYIIKPYQQDTFLEKVISKLKG